ncbi:hypothetical protein [Rathayibacter sp. Leaf296]|uniref:hypothetical protein n=1 Tax=Rathayibacter sp. Leaf296 TaxID=1736327 RepID=UPI0007032ACC|nr:hypothetical protein [Rathayibacter sp. Leaf296]KQQ10335.1 hypothetical protein ASF46_04490 [Rathayibacter sp. Leaf296]
MENDDILRELSADRARLADRVRTPWWLGVGFGVVAALFVVRPAAGEDLPGGILPALALGAVLLWAYRRATGVALGRLGAMPWLLTGAALVLVLALYSVALGFASFDLHGWVALPTAVAFAVGVGATFAFTASARERMRRVR